MGSMLMEQTKPPESFFEGIPEAKEYFKFDNGFKQKIYETGFIYLVASFEDLMNELLKELLQKNPTKIPVQRKEKIQKKTKFSFVEPSELEEFLLDSYSTEKSFNVTVWEQTLFEDFGIKVFDDLKDKQMIIGMRIFRNAILHAGGKRNSVFLRESLKLFPENALGNIKFSNGRAMLDNDKLFKYSLIVLRDVAKKVETKFAGFEA